ncbi:hypothetical protein PCC7424_0141 [Gloeothece citriformis PCC 7424]|uniref:Uncharacterized protein n=1 Tax=Gloeothece citriformis (strain PCC 7424) TaxID=65393 RepID=B7K9C8_GLOC7|nr:hypothetical protein [Gloeothece citriformis]ACK68611.1 hypothetical protein PCC7424_0141 [Gloeothece citriformis PCC 7424]
MWILTFNGHLVNLNLIEAVCFDNWKEDFRVIAYGQASSEDYASSWVLCQYKTQEEAENYLNNLRWMLGAKFVVDPGDSSKVDPKVDPPEIPFSEPVSGGAA